MTFCEFEGKNKVCQSLKRGLTPAEAVVLSRQDLIACLLAISLLRLSLGAALLGL